jgi:hypothetical protein
MPPCRPEPSASITEIDGSPIAYSSARIASNRSWRM